MGLMDILDPPASKVSALPAEESFPKTTEPRFNAVLILLAGIVLAGVALSLSLYRYSVDDAWISFRYVHNIAQGYGPVWNRGEHVEGYSNPLWIVLLVPFALVHASLIAAAKWIGIACSAATALTVFRLVRRYTNDCPQAGLIAAGLIGGDIFFAAWSVGGLETPLFALLVVVFTGLILPAPDQNRPNIWPGAAVFLLAVTRPEGCLFAFLGSLYLAVFQLRRRRFDIAQWAWLGAFILLFGAFTVWRFEYYGYLLPNTYWAKTGGGFAKIAVGLTYIENYCTIHFLLIAAAIAGAALPAVRANRLYLWSLLCVAAYFAFIVAVGGDWMPAARFVMSVFGLICACCGISVAQIARSFAVRPRGAAALTLGIVLVLLAQTDIAERITLGGEAGWLYTDRLPNPAESQVAAYLQAHAKPGEWVAVQEAGIIPYLNPDLSFIDILGLNDAHIAHHVSGLLHSDPGDPSYVLARDPQWLALWVHVHADGSYDGAMPAVARIIANPLTKENYRLVARLPQPAPGRPWPKGHVYYIYRRD